MLLWGTCHCHGLAVYIEEEIIHLHGEGRMILLCVCELGWKFKVLSFLYKHVFSCNPVLCVCVQCWHNICWAHDYYYRAHSVLNITIRVSYERAEGGEHLLELALHVFVVEELVCGYETLVQVQRIMTCIQQRPLEKDYE